MSSTPTTPRVVRQYRDMAEPTVVPLDAGRSLELYADQGRLHVVVRRPQAGRPRAVDASFTIASSEARALAAALIVGAERAEGEAG